MYTTIIYKPLHEAIDDLLGAISDAGMLLLSHINGQANAAKIGEMVTPVCVLEVFRPELAVRVWRTHQPAGIDIPVRLYIYEDDEGRTVVNYRSLLQTMLKYNIPELSAVGRDADKVFAGIMRAVSDQPLRAVQTN